MAQLTDKEVRYIRYLEAIDFFNNIYTILSFELTRNNNDNFKSKIQKAHINIYRELLEDMQLDESLCDRDAIKCDKPVLMFRYWLEACNILWKIYYRHSIGENINPGDVKDLKWAVEQLEEQILYMFELKTRVNVFKKLEKFSHTDKEITKR